MKIKSKWLYWITLFSICLGSLSMVQADDEYKSYRDFSVTPIYNENQVDGISGYFDILAPNDSTQTVQIQLDNYGDEDMIASIQVNNGITKEDATYDYHSSFQASEYIPISFTQLVQLESHEFAVAKGESIVITIQVEMPKEEFLGSILGALEIKAKALSQEKVENEGTKVNADLSYIVAFHLRNSMDFVDPDIKVVESGVDIVDGQPTFYNKIQSKNGAFLRNVMIRGVITNLDTRREVGHVDVENGQILPYSEFSINYPFDDLVSELTPGKYNYSLELTLGEEISTLSGIITISDKESKQIIDGVQQDNNYFQIFILIITIVILLSLITVMMYKNRLERRDD